MSATWERQESAKSISCPRVWTRRSTSLRIKFRNRLSLKCPSSGRDSTWRDMNRFGESRRRHGSRCADPAGHPLHQEFLLLEERPEACPSLKPRQGRLSASVFTPIRNRLWAGIPAPTGCGKSWELEAFSWESTASESKSSRGTASTVRGSTQPKRCCPESVTFW